MNHKVVSGVLGAILVALGIFGASYLIKNKKKPQSIVQKVIKTVYVDTVANGEVPVIINANGTIVAKRRIELFSEVQGVFVSSAKLFREGQSYRKGEVLLRINDEEFGASVQSQKSILVNLITGVLPDLRLDYPEAFPAWEQYLKDFDMGKVTPELPQPASQQVKNFLIGRGVYASYYNLKNLEQRLSKHVIRAPFDGILTEAQVNEGTLVRAGQRLGEFIDPSVYEVEVSVNKSFAPYLKAGEEVELSNLENTTSWKGKVSRVNGKIDQATQTITAFVEVAAPEIKEGMYLQANIHARDVDSAFKIERSLLVDRSRMFVVKDTVLELVPVKPVFYSEKHVIVKGLKDGALVLSKAVPGAYPGMVIKVADTPAEFDQNTAAQ